MTKRDEWIRVRDESELKVGMCVEVRLCDRCGVTHRVILSRPGLPYEGSPTWHGVVPPCRGGRGGTWVCFRYTIGERRLFRLADSQLTESETTRELERVK